MTGNIVLGMAFLIGVGVCSQQAFAHLNGWDEAALSANERTKNVQAIVAPEPTHLPNLDRPRPARQANVEQQAEVGVEPSRRRPTPKP